MAKPWTRNQKIALSAVIVAIVAAVATWSGIFSKLKGGITTTTSGNNSPTAVTTGNNSPVTQTVNNYDYPSNEINTAAEKQDEMLAMLRRMETFKKEKESNPDFNKFFPLGYILFTATGRKEIISQQPSPMDEIEFRWSEGYSVEMTTTNATIHLPSFVVHNGASTAHFSIGSIGLPRAVGYATSPMRFSSNVLTFLTVSTNTNETMVAVGLQPVDLLQQQMHQNSRKKESP
jgi:hypothetical protein